MLSKEEQHRLAVLEELQQALAEHLLSVTDSVERMHQTYHSAISWALRISVFCLLAMVLLLALSLFLPAYSVAGSAGLANAAANIVARRPL